MRSTHTGSVPLASSHVGTAFKMAAKIETYWRGTALGNAGNVGVKPGLKRQRANDDGPLSIFMQWFMAALSEA